MPTIERTWLCRKERASARTSISSPAIDSPISCEPAALVLALDGEVRARPWPRSPLAQDDRAMEAYLVRHNALMAADGLGGFMPYVDVVAHGEPGADEPDSEQDRR